LVDGAAWPRPDEGGPKSDGEPNRGSAAPVRRGGGIGGGRGRCGTWLGAGAGCVLRCIGRGGGCTGGAGRGSAMGGDDPGGNVLGRIEPCGDGGGVPTDGGP